MNSFFILSYLFVTLSFLNISQAEEPNATQPTAQKTVGSEEQTLPGAVRSETSEAIVILAPPAAPMLLSEEEGGPNDNNDDVDEAINDIGEPLHRPHFETVEADQIAKIIRGEDVKPEEGTTFEITAILWPNGFQGTQVKNGLTANVGTTIGDRIDHLQPGGALQLKFTKGKWVFVLESHYAQVKLWGSVHLPQFNVDVPVTVKESEYLMIEYLAGRRWDVLNEGTYIEFLVGGRYLTYDVTGQTIFGSDTTEYRWNDPVLRMNFNAQLSPRTALYLSGATAGFGISDQSTEYSHDARAMFVFQIGDNTFVGAGYRFFKGDFDGRKLKPVPASLKFVDKGFEANLTYRWGGAKKRKPKTEEKK